MLVGLGPTRSLPSQWDGVQALQFALYSSVVARAITRRRVTLWLSLRSGAHAQAATLGESMLISLLSLTSAAFLWQLNKRVGGLRPSPFPFQGRP